MIGALHLARRRGTISNQQFDRLEYLVHFYGLLPAFSVGAKKLVAATSGDKRTLGACGALCCHWESAMRELWRM